MRILYIVCNEGLGLWLVFGLGLRDAYPDSGETHGTVT